MLVQLGGIVRRVRTLIPSVVQCIVTQKRSTRTCKQQFVACKSYDTMVAESQTDVVDIDSDSSVYGRMGGR